MKGSRPLSFQELFELLNTSLCCCFSYYYNVSVNPFYIHLQAYYQYEKSITYLLANQKRITNKKVKEAIQRDLRADSEKSSAWRLHKISFLMFGNWNNDLEKSVGPKHFQHSLVNVRPVSAVCSFFFSSLTWKGWESILT